LQTAETKLSEVDPETAEKVRSSRGVRMKGIKESLGGKMMQLEQRSGSTSFMTGEKLRELLPKAKETWDEWLIQRKNLFEDLKNQLGGEVSEDFRAKKLAERIGGSMLTGTRG
jgi:hypothetical protein